ncbi:Arabinose operon regulatory protein [Robinsoniella peoriensis]|uniref:Arabinose operon regulatory protein n=2 Tax=Robinsoniella peoriensis TaxID=180332 RepID=A0A4U8QBI2_9FIRM|nr:Arabinose operon regulatory protein [Robinsoniella peoriensis]
MEKMGFCKRLKRSGRLKYKMRILLAFFAVAVLAIGFTDVAVFRGLSANIREDTDKETREMLRNLNNSYENQVMQYQDQAQLLYRNLNVKAFLVSGGREDSHIDTIYESMKAMAGNMTGISSVILFYKEDILASYDTGMVTVAAKEEIVKAASDTVSDKDIFYVWPNDRKYQKHMVILWSDRDYPNAPSNYGVALAINMDAVQEKVIPWNQKAVNPIYIFHKSGELVAAQRNEYKEEAQKMFQEICTKEIDEDSFNESVDGKKRAISYVREGDGRFLSLRIQDMSGSQIQINRALQTILFATVLGMLVIAGAVWVLSGWVYRPVGAIFRNILQLAQSGEETVKGKDELILATDALEDVNQNMNLLKSQIRNNAAVRFLRYGRSGDVVDQKMFEFGDCEPDNFTVIVLRYFLEDWSKNEALFAYVKEIRWVQRENRKGGMHCYRASQGEIIFLDYSMREEGSPHAVCHDNHGMMDISSDSIPLEEDAGKLLEELKSLYGMKGCMGIAHCSRPDRLPKAYHRAELLTEYYILAKDMQVTDESVLKAKRQGAVQEPERDHILRFVKNDTEEDLNACMQRLLKNLTSYHILEAQKYLKELIADVIRLSESISGEKSEQYEMYLEDFLTNQIFIGQADIEEWLCQLFLQVRAQLKSSRQPNAVYIMVEVEVYVGENYRDCGLSVEAVAEHYGLSVSYFSKLFNQHTGKTFPDYISQLRLKKAREMLLEKQNMTIQEIAKEVGFNSSSYFSAAFRKFYGVSPSQIRRVKTKD